MKKYAFTALLLIYAISANPAAAACYGSGSFKTCYDTDSGNSYSVRKSGNTTHTDGYNSSTGSNWSQTSRRIGNSVYHDGTAADGGSWSIQQRSYGNTTTYSGHDSDGNSVFKTCTNLGCF